MSLPLFLGPADLLGSVVPGATLELGGPEGRHAAGAMRLRVGEELLIGDGSGRLLACEVVGLLGREGLTARVLQVQDHLRPTPSVTVVQALAKADRGELAVELMTEVGVEEVVPWAAQRCVTRWRADRVDRGLARWRAVAEAAGKQARRVWLPTITELATTTQVQERVEAATLSLVLHEEAAQALSDVHLPTEGTVLLVVGPEGGLTGEEIERFQAAGGLPVRLGSTILRTSTAGAVAAALVMAGTGRW